MTISAELPEIPQRELRNNVSRVLREVGAGHSYTITVDGNPVADLVPHRGMRRRVAVPREEAIAAFRGLSSSAQEWRDDSDLFIDDSLYDPYDRAYRRGEFGVGDKG
ncbi:type II toxin-antitoxin system prevent-host-death family antitoxin [Nocardia panacis]|uniref:Type II toxin-antitoxin system prevent-host-death family antitoxin n=1 Tax=Nocardia panacis TaxID=2340916 RepID=A0A3A4KJ20_9NOCA|nr:type II toxin-antitoxin system prevent-host-death family antitoxin [Nocardia panacis]RJO74872.1 type II toxin-antitoxin system prevent-host-death family antitoxin [Nocardia panacis]